MKSKSTEYSISKNEAIALCKKNGLNISGNITFSSRNKGTNTYWANPNIKYLNEDWWIIFNDNRKKELNVLFIPVNTIKESQILRRNDKPHQIDLQFNYDGNRTFFDSRSRLYFDQWYVKTIEY